ncbi:MAG: hypothetical protein HY305_07250 [Sphingobacteriales bacterium]|nr:hypothetical protein [Sphingobacteriales bacterium]
MTKLLFTCLLFLTVSAKAQTNDSLIGNWKFKSIYQAEKLDAKSVQMLHMMFSNMTLDLKADKSYSAILFTAETGTWAYTPASKLLTLTNVKGKINQVEILHIAAKEIVLSLGKDKNIVLSKL